MPLIIGPKTLANIELPAGIDAEYLLKQQMVEGATYAEVLTDINDAMIMAQVEVDADPLLNMLMSETEKIDATYREGAGFTFEDSTELGEGDEQGTERSGHMLPIKEQDVKLGYSTAFLESTTRDAIDDDISGVMDAYKDTITKRAITRAFQMEADTGRALGLGAAGVSVPLCDAGACGITYTPPNGRDNKAFASSHTHYLRLNGITQANIETAVLHLWEHKHDGPFDALIPFDDIAAWQNTTNVTGFKPRGQAGIVYSANESQAQLEDMYFGAVVTPYGVLRLLGTSRVPTGVWHVRKSYGPRDARNTVLSRIDKRFGNAPKFVVPVAKLIPVQGALIRYRRGFGITFDRTNGVCVKNASSGVYATPAIS